MDFLSYVFVNVGSIISNTNRHDGGNVSRIISRVSGQLRKWIASQ